MRIDSCVIESRPPGTPKRGQIVTGPYRARNAQPKNRATMTFESGQPTIDHPPHYNAHPSGVECIDIAKFHCFCLGNAIKYIWRAGLKTDNPVEDLRKAIWYLNKKVEMYGGSEKHCRE